MTSVDDFLIDFRKEEEGAGGRISIKPGRYHGKILKAKPTTSADKGTPGLALTIKLLSGAGKGKTFVETLWISPKSLSRFRNLLEACELKVPVTVNALKIGKAVLGKELALDITTQRDRSGQYPDKSVVDFNGFYPLDELEAGTDEGSADDDELSLDDDLSLDSEDEPKSKAKPDGEDVDLGELDLDEF
jgi:hypothetical protein